MDSFFGTYHNFKTSSKNDGAALLGADNLIGDVYHIEFEFEKGSHRAWLVNRFRKRVGFFDPSFSRQLKIKSTQGYLIRAVLAYVAYTELPEGGNYWGSAAVISYKPDFEKSFSSFIDHVSQRLSDGALPCIELNEEEVQRVVASQGAWFIQRSLSYPDVSKNTVIIKKRRSLKDKLIEQGRKGNRGCFFFSWVFVLLSIALTVYLVKIFFVATFF